MGRLPWWDSICLPMQGTQVWYLVREDSNAMEQLSPGATASKPTLQSLQGTITKAHVPIACAPQEEKFHSKYGKKSSEPKR